MSSRILLSVLGAGVLLVGCSSSSAEEVSPAAVDAPAATQPVPRRIPVRVVELVREDVTEELDLTGTARPWDEFEVSAEVSGRISALHVEEGEWVQKGRLMAELDRSKRDLQLEARQADLERTRIDVEFARKRLARGESLLAKGAISQAEVDTLEQAVQVAESAVRLAEIAVDTIREEIEDTRVLAPATGRVSARTVSLGETVSPSGILFRLIQIDPLKIVTEIPEAHLHLIRPGQAVRIVFEALSPQPRRGTVHFIHPVANPSSGAFPTEVRLPNPGRRLQPGMVARVRLETSTLRDALLAPLDALVDLEGRYFVYVVDGEKAVRRPVEVRQRIGARAVLEGDVAEGNEVVTGGNQNLTDGAAVEVVR